jgi:hypothetical protein
MDFARTMVAMVTVACLGGAALAEEHQHSAPAPVAVSNPAWDKLKTLVGAWDGSMTDGGKTLPTTTSFKLVSGNSTILNYLAEGKPMEMITMFHPDLKDILATHYCAEGNQPRMKLVPSAAPNQLTFEFKDGTNIPAGGSHMQKLVITFVDANHHVQEWTHRDKGKDMTGRFDFHRAGTAK